MDNRKNKRDTQQSLDFIIEQMVTKDDFVRLETKVDDIEARIDGIDGTLREIQKTLDDHGQDLETIKGDVKTNLDKRMQLEVRVGSIEKHLDIKPPVGTTR